MALAWLRGRRAGLYGIALVLLGLAAASLWYLKTTQDREIADALAAIEAAAALAPDKAGGACPPLMERARQMAQSIAADEARALEASRAYRALGQCNLLLNKLDAAAADFRSAIAHRAEYAPLHGDLAQALSRLGQHNPAQRSAGLAIQLDPQVWVAHRLLARVLDAGGKVGEAERSYEEALRLAPPEQIKKLQDEINRFKQAHESARTTRPIDPPQPRSAP